MDGRPGAPHALCFLRSNSPVLDGPQLDRAAYLKVSVQTAFRGVLQQTEVRVAVPLNAGGVIFGPLRPASRDRQRDRRPLQRGAMSHRRADRESLKYIRLR